MSFQALSISVRHCCDELIHYALICLSKKVFLIRPPSSEELVLLKT
jgi:hypothetical protein